MAGEEKVEKSNILMYTTEDGVTKVEVTFDNDTVWLSLDHIADPVSYTHLDVYKRQTINIL